MISKEPLKQILGATRPHWQNPQTRPAVRENFEKMILCRTPALGAEVFASQTEEKCCYHTCKSRACPSCGYRATLLWLREQWAALPDIPHSGLVLTMPGVLWPIFRQNRHLLHDLPALGAAVVEQWIKGKYGVRVLIMVVPHSGAAYLRWVLEFQLSSPHSGISQRLEGGRRPLDITSVLRQKRIDEDVAECCHRLLARSAESRSTRV
jgi:hypothetical protein